MQDQNILYEIQQIIPSPSRGGVGDGLAFDLDEEPIPMALGHPVPTFPLKGKVGRSNNQLLIWHYPKNTATS